MLIVRFIGDRPENSRYKVYLGEGDNIIRFAVPSPYDDASEYQLYFGGVNVSNGYDYSDIRQIWASVEARRISGEIVYESDPLLIEVYDRVSQLSKEMVPSTDQPNMQLVTDENGEKKWEERTHYRKYTTLLDETIKAVYEHAMTSSYRLNKGETYDVVLDDVEYSVVCESDEWGGLTLVVPDGVHTVWMDAISGEYFFCSETDNLSEHTLIVKGWTYNTINPAYLPNANEEEAGIISLSNIRQSFDVFFDLEIGKTTQREVMRLKKISDVINYNWRGYRPIGEWSLAGDNDWHNGCCLTCRAISSTDGMVQIHAVFDTEDEDSVLREVEIVREQHSRGLFLRSITPGSTKKFIITVDDSGVITATEEEA